MHRIDPLTDRVSREIEREYESLIITPVNGETRGLVHHYDRFVMVENADG